MNQEAHLFQPMPLRSRLCSLPWRSIFGTGFGIVTDIQTGPDGSLYLVSPSDGSIRKITRP